MDLMAPQALKRKTRPLLVPLIAVAFLLVIALAVLAVLPSPVQIVGKSFLPPKKTEVARPAVSVRQENSPRNALPVVSPVPRPSQALRSNEASDEQVAVRQYLVGRFVEGGSTPDVCNFMEASRDDTDNNETHFLRELGAVAEGRKDGDPYVESVLGPVTYIAAIPAVRDLLRAATELAASQRTDLAGKALFYSRVALAAGALIARKAEIEKAADRSYLLYNFTKALRERPDLIGTQAAGNVCESLRQGLSVAGSEKALRTELEGFLGAEGIRPEQIGYDPTYTSHIEVVSNRGFLQIKIPWIDAILRNRGSR